METPENTNDLLENDKSPRKKPIEKWYPYFLPNGNMKEKELKQQFELADCPTRDDVEAALVESKFHPIGKYRIERKISGQPTKDYFYCEKPEASFFQQTQQKQIVDFEDLAAPHSKEPNSKIEELLSRLIQKVEDLEDRELERQETPESGQSDTVLLIKEMQRQNDKNLDRYIGLLENVMKSQQQPKENPTDLMLSMLKGTLEVQRGVRDLSEQIAPDNSGGGSMLGDAAKLINSVGQNAGTLLPILGGLLGGSPKAAPNVSTNGNGQGELSGLLKKAKKEGISKK